MPISKRILSLIMSATISISCLTAHANETVTAEGDDECADTAIATEVKEDPLESVFSATIPAVIPAAVDTNGLVTVPNNIEIRNNNTHHGIAATEISAQTSDGWSLADYNSGEFNSVNGRNIGLTLRGDKVDDQTGKVTLSEGNWAINAGSSLPIDLGLKVNPQSRVGSVGSVATISFTLDWGKGEAPDPIDPATIDWSQKVKMRNISNAEYDKLCDATSESNDLMHWQNMWSWTDEVYNGQASSRVIRGFDSARSSSYTDVTYYRAFRGARPAFEILNSDDRTGLSVGDVVTIGTFYVGDNPIKVPTNPVKSGDVHSYGSSNSQKITLGKALDDAAYQMKAIYVGDGVFVCDRVMLVNISWNQLNAALS